MPTFTNSTCPSDIAKNLYFDRMLNMHGKSLNVLTTTNPPRVIRTVGYYENDEIINNIGGLDVMISDVIGKTLNLTFRYIILLNTTRLIGSKVNSSYMLANKTYVSVISKLYFSIILQQNHVSSISNRIFLKIKEMLTNSHI